MSAKVETGYCADRAQPIGIEKRKLNRRLGKRQNALAIDQRDTLGLAIGDGENGLPTEYHML